MSAFGGTNGDKYGRKIAYALVDKLFSREFLTQCSWTGSSKRNSPKHNFSTATSFFKAFYEIVKKADTRYSMTEAKEFFQLKVLRNSATRLQQTLSKKLNESGKIQSEDLQNRSLDPHENHDAMNLV